MRKKGTRIASVLLSVLVLFAFMPVLGMGGFEAYAGGDVVLGDIIQGLNSDDTVTAGKEIYVTMTSLKDVYGEEFESLYNSGKVKCYFTVYSGEGEDYAATDHEVKLKDGRFSYIPLKTDIGKKIQFFTIGEDSHYSNNTDGHTIKSDGKPFIDIIGNMTKDGKITVFGDAGSGGLTFKQLSIIYRPTTDPADAKIIDFYSTGISGQKSFTQVIEMKKYDLGYYELVADLSNGSKVAYERVVPSLNYQKPAIKKNKDFFSTGYNYICFRPYFTVPKDSHTGKPIFGKIYIQLYDTKTKKWGDVYGPYDSYQKAKTQYFTGTKSKGGTKLAANRTYKVRAFYALDTKYAGSTYPFIGPFSNTVTIKTGKSSKLAIKSIKVKAKKVKKVKLIQHAHWDVSGKWHPYKTSYTWTTTYKVTVKLKKKPGTAGICIGSKRVKGNKKTYTATFTDPGKLKGKKIKVQVCSYNDSATGAYGPPTTKKVKMK